MLVAFVVAVVVVVVFVVSGEHSKPARTVIAAATG
jgi:hypothetical protein